LEKVLKPVPSRDPAVFIVGLEEGTKNWACFGSKLPQENFAKQGQKFGQACKSENGSP